MAKTVENDRYSGVYIPRIKTLDGGTAYVSGGLDIGSFEKDTEACGAPIEAVESGVVTEIDMDGWNDGKGAYIRVEGHEVKEYIHIGEPRVSVGHEVKIHEVIGTVGRSGLQVSSPCKKEIE